MTLNTRRPTGKPSWPILNLAGREGAGKSWSAAEASASDLIGRTLWVGVGEDAPDEYSLIPGADFEIVEHDGKYLSILTALTEIAALPPLTEGKQTLLVLDSGTRMWQLITDNAQATANARAARKAAKYNKSAPSGDQQITMDLWNVAATQWGHIVDTLRAHRGPSIITTRLDQVAIVENGQPTTEKAWKVQAHKSLPYDVSAQVEMEERGKYRISKVKSARLQLEHPKDWPNFTVDALWRALGLHEVETAPRHHDAPTVAAEDEPEAGERDWIADADAAASSAAASKIGAAAAAVLGKDHEIVDRIRQIVTEKREAVAALDAEAGS